MATTLTWRRTNFRIFAFVDVLAVLSVSGESVTVGALASEAALGVLTTTVLADVEPIKERNVKLWRTWYITYKKIL
jgi:hypothetical protein